MDNYFVREFDQMWNVVKLWDPDKYLETILFQKIEYDYACRRGGAGQVVPARFARGLRAGTDGRAIHTAGGWAV